MSTWHGNGTAPVTSKFWIRIHTTFGEWNCDLDDKWVCCLATPGVEYGSDVLMYDADGNELKGVVVRMDDRVFWVKPDWTTWKPTEDPTP